TRTLAAHTLANNNPDNRNLWQEKLFNDFIPLCDLAPAFYANGEQITLLNEPKIFYNELKKSFLLAKKRILLAALYIGSNEHELFATIREALETSANLQVHILVDYLRSTRPGPNGIQDTTAHSLFPLVRDFPDRIVVSMYHTPDLAGLLKKTLPSRFNESIGLMHIKAFVFDDDIILSGANLSRNYFTNRQDRYVIFKNLPCLADYFADLLRTIEYFSYKLQPADDSTFALETPKANDPISQNTLFRSNANLAMTEFIQRWMKKSKDGDLKPLDEIPVDTVIFPAIQMGPLRIRQDEKAFLNVLDVVHRQGCLRARESSLWTVVFTSGYFNISRKYRHKILNSDAKFEIITASPEASYRNFKLDLCASPEKLSISISSIAGQWIFQLGCEYKRPEWTYHAKGLWIYMSDNRYPCVTFIGSPNYGDRSTERDLEAEVILLTRNENLRKAEVRNLQKYSKPVTDATFDSERRRVPYLVRLATAFIKTML
ncbi:6754_t:CDS:2, partial [Paraglomus occultum]